MLDPGWGLDHRHGVTIHLLVAGFRPAKNDFEPGFREREFFDQLLHRDAAIAALASARYRLHLR